METFETNLKPKDYSPNGAKRFIEKVKPFLIGKTIQKVFAKDLFVYESFNQDIPITQQEYIDTEWDGPFILKIADNQLEINLWQSNRYKLSFNKVVIENVVDATKVPVSDISILNFDEGFVDVSEYYSSILNLKICDIFVTEGIYNDGDEYLSDITIMFNNGKKMIITDEIDGTSVTIL